MKYLLRIFALLAVSTLVFAAGSKTFTWLPPTEREADPDSGFVAPLPQNEIAEYRIYCDGSVTPVHVQPNEPLNTDTWAAPSGTFATGAHNCVATTVDTEGQESDVSNSVNFIVSPERPKAPIFAVQ